MAIFVLGQSGFTREQVIYETPLPLINQILLAYAISQGAEMEWLENHVDDTVREKLERLKLWQSEPPSESR